LTENQINRLGVLNAITLIPPGRISTGTIDSGYAGSAPQSAHASAAPRQARVNGNSEKTATGATPAQEKHMVDGPQVDMLSRIFFYHLTSLSSAYTKLFAPPCLLLIFFWIKNQNA